MSYTPTTWANGDTITAQKMNNIEQGIVAASGGGGPLCCNITMNADNEFVADQTLADVTAALAAGDLVLISSMGGLSLYTELQGGGTGRDPYWISCDVCGFESVGQQGGIMHVINLTWSEENGIQVAGQSSVALTPAE